MELCCALAAWKAFSVLPICLPVLMQLEAGLHRWRFAAGFLEAAYSGNLQWPMLERAAQSSAAQECFTPPLSSLDHSAFDPRKTNTPSCLAPCQEETDQAHSSLRRSPWPRTLGTNPGLSAMPINPHYHQQLGA